MVDGEGLAIIIIITWIVGVLCGVLIKIQHENDNAMENKVFRKIVPTDIIEAIASGEMRFDIVKDKDGIQIKDEVVYNDGSGFTQHRTVKYILRSTKENGLKSGYSIIGF